MKSKGKCFTRVLLLFLLVGLLTLAVFPGTTDEAGKAEKQEKESTSFFKKVGKGFGALFKPSNLRLELNGGWSAWGVGDFKRANEFIENTYQGSAAYTAETTGFSGSMLGGLKVFAEYKLANSSKLGLGSGLKFLPGGSFEQVVTSATESITRGFDMSSFAIPLELSYKMPLKMRIFKKPLSLRFGAGLDFISSTIDYVFDRSVTAANGGLNNLSRTAANGSEHTVIKLRDSALGGHISVGLEYPFGKNFGLTLDAGYSFGSLDRFTGTYTDQHGEQRDVVLGKDSEYSDYIIPFIYHDTVCPSLTTASINPGGPSISIGITYYPGTGQERTKPEEYLLQERTDTRKWPCDCLLSSSEIGFPPIKVRRGLDYYPREREMCGGSLIALSVLASDSDVINHTCTEKGRAWGKRYFIGDKVDYIWRCRGVGKLLQTSGNTVFYKLPTNMPKNSRKRVVIGCTISSDLDTSISGKVEIRIRRGNDECIDATAPLYLNVRVVPVKEKKAAGLPPLPIGTCRPKLEIVKKSPTGSWQIPTSACPDELIRLSSTLTSEYEYILKCLSDNCSEPIPKRIPRTFPLQFEWSDNGAGGSFPLGNKGSQVAYLMPKKGETVRLSAGPIKVERAEETGDESKPENYDNVVPGNPGRGPNPVAILAGCKTCIEDKEGSDWLPRGDVRYGGKKGKRGKTHKYETWWVCGADCAKAPGARLKKKITVYLKDISRNPGVACNWGKRDNRELDFQFERRLNPGWWFKAVGNNGLKATTRCPVPEGQRVEIIVSAFDFAARAKISAQASRCDESEILAIPRDDDNDKIADAWEAGQRLNGNNTLDDRDDNPRGDGFLGDGLTAFEEYRGFVVLNEENQQSEHLRTNVKDKDLFIRVTKKSGSIRSSGYEYVELFESISGLQVHFINENQWSSKRVINFNKVAGTNDVSQHGLHLSFESSSVGSKEGQAVTNLTNYIFKSQQKVKEVEYWPSTPDEVRVINVYPNRSRRIIRNRLQRNHIPRRRWASHIELRIKQIVAHELAHGLNVYHHGEGQDTRLGDRNCVMCYDVPIGRHNDLPDLRFCTTRGTSIRDRGNCAGQIRVNDKGSPRRRFIARTIKTITFRNFTGSNVTALRLSFNEPVNVPNIAPFEKVTRLKGYTNYAFYLGRGQTLAPGATVELTFYTNMDINRVFVSWRKVGKSSFGRVETQRVR